MSKNQKLKVEIKNNTLIISIGVSTLAKAIKIGSGLFEDEDIDGKFKIVNENKFAKSILSELQDEDEIGTTLVHTMLDKAGENAIENGCEGIEYSN
jgi:hypothetical protein